MRFLQKGLENGIQHTYYAIEKALTFLVLVHLLDLFVKDRMLQGIKIYLTTLKKVLYKRNKVKDFLFVTKSYIR